MARSVPVDGFVTDYTVHGAHTDPAVLLLHGWPGGSQDYREVVPLLTGLHVVVPDLRGFGQSDRHLRDPRTDYSAAAQARSVAALITELGLDRPVLAGYDVGSRVSQQLARDRPDLVGALAISPPLPGAGPRVLQPEAAPEFWYRSLHQLPLAVTLLDGRREQIGQYLRHFWGHWSSPTYAIDEARFDALVDDCARPGAFEASINWYRAGAGTLAQSATEHPPAERTAAPTIVLWPDRDPLFPRSWSDRLDEWFADVEVRHADGVGHFTPLEAPDAFADMVRTAVQRRR